MRKRIKNFLEKLKFVENYQRFLRATSKEVMATGGTENLARPRASPLAATKRLKVGSYRSGECFSPSPFFSPPQLFREGGEKRTTAKNKRPKVPF